ncbi:MAG: hypothetical protein ACLFU0_06340 [Alphaproteobacteria bacterium]
MTAIADHPNRPGFGGLTRLVRELVAAFATAQRASAERRALAELEAYPFTEIELDLAGRRGIGEPAAARAARRRGFG